MTIRVKTFFLLLLFIMISETALAQEGKLVFAIDIIRHGDRTPVLNIPTVEMKLSEEEFGQLTPVGMRQEFQLGQNFHQRYVKQHALLPSHYASGLIYVRSTDFDRTIMSAQSVLMGLYPLHSGPKLPDSDKFALPSGYQPIPIHTIPIEQDLEFKPDDDKKMMEELITKYVFQRKDWQEKSAKAQLNFSRWGELTGIKISGLYDLIDIGNALDFYNRYHLPLPKGMTNEEAKEIIELRDWTYAAVFRPTEVGEATGGKLLKRVADLLEQASTGKSTLKWVLFSAHDVTLLALLSAMHAPLSDSPPYASHLNFSLIKKSREDYVVKIGFNNQDVFIPGCGGATCSLSQFMAL